MLVVAFTIPSPPFEKFYADMLWCFLNLLPSFSPPVASEVSVFQNARRLPEFWGTFSVSLAWFKRLLVLFF